MICHAKQCRHHHKNCCLAGANESMIREFINEIDTTGNVFFQPEVDIDAQGRCMSFSVES